MKSILALDLATTTGWAFGVMDAEPECGTLNLPKGSKDIGVFLCSYSNWLEAALSKMQPDWVMYEVPILPKTTNPATILKLNALAGHTEFVASRRSLPYRFIRNTRALKHFTGFGGGKSVDRKARTMDACRARGWKPEDQDQADALQLWDYAVFCLNPKESHTIALNGMGAGA